MNEINKLQNTLSLYQNDTSPEAQYYYKKVKKLLEEEREKIAHSNTTFATETEPLLQDIYEAYEEAMCKTSNSYERSKSFESSI